MKEGLIREYVRQLLIEDKRGRVMKMGFPKEFAQMLHDFWPPWTRKYADWMAKELLKQKGWNHVVKTYKNKKELNKWLKIAWKEHGIRSYVKTKDAFEIIFKWMDSKNGGPKLNKMTLNQAYEKAWLHPALMKSEEEGEVIVTFKNGWRWINLMVTDCEPEATAMDHCASDSTGNLWSLRDKKGYPHVTCTVDDEGMIQQMKGKSNSIPKEEYHPYIVRLLSDTDISGIKTEEGEDFSWNDLSEEDQEKVMEANPEFNAEGTSSLVELLRSGDVERMKEEGVFVNTTQLDGWSATFLVHPGEIVGLWNGDDAWSERQERNTQEIASSVLRDDVFEDHDHLWDEFSEMWNSGQFVHLRNLIGTANRQTIKDMVFQMYPEEVMEWFTLEGDPERAKKHLDMEDLEEVLENVVQVEDPIYESLQESWVEARSAAALEGATHVLFESVKETVVDEIWFVETGGKEGFQHRGRIRMKVSYDRMADFVDMHHPGTPMDGRDYVNMIEEIDENFSSNYRVSVSWEDFYGHEDWDKTTFDEDLTRSLRYVARNLKPKELPPQEKMLDKPDEV